MTTSPTATTASSPPTPVSRTDVGAAPLPPGTDLAAAVEAGISRLGDLRVLGRDVASGELRHALGVAVLHHQHRTGAAGPDRLARAAIAVRIACAHLDAGGLVEARLALDDARDALPRRDQVDVDDRHVDDRARAASESQQRILRAGAIVPQAGGVLAGHTGLTPAQALAALREYAARHRVVLADLAADVVAGRVAPGVVVDPATAPDPSARTDHRQER